MKKTKKFLIGALVMLIFCASFVACGKTGDSQNSSMRESISAEISNSIEESSSAENNSSEEVHVHSYVSETTKQPDCENNGKKTYTCDCGENYTEEILALGHDYKNDECTRCGEKKPSDGLEYQLILNGKSYAVVDIGECEDTDLVIPSTYNNLPVTHIGYGAFRNCDNLTSVEIGDSVTSIGSWAFAWGSNLTSVEIPDSVTSIGYSAFAYCSSLTSVVIPDSVTSIGDYAFEWCESLTSVVIPDSVTSIGDEAFDFCSSLTSVVIPDSVTSMGWSAFRECSSLTSVEIGDSVTSIVSETFYRCSSLTSIEVSENNIAYKSIDGNLYTKDGTTLVQYAIGKTATSFTIPDSVTNIGYEAFRYCSSLTEIVIPDGVTSIGDYAFEDCSSLTNVEIGDSVTSIGDYAFNFCSSLTNIKFNGTVAQWNEIEKGNRWNGEILATEVICTDGTVAI